LAAAPALGLILWIGASGCETAPVPQITSMPGATNTESLLLHEGDVLQIKFPATPELDSQPTIRSDGKITIPMVGDIKVSGLTPDAARQAVLDAVSPKLRNAQVTLNVQTAAFIIYVTGAVLRPGEIIADRPLTPFEAVIKAGIDNARSNLAKVKVIRTDEHSHTEQKTLNLKDIITKSKTEPFALKPYDVIYVPEKFTWF
jgi:polysaccharide export outer membrane protein